VRYVLSDYAASRFLIERKLAEDEALIKEKMTRSKARLKPRGSGQNNAFYVEGRVTDVDLEESLSLDAIINLRGEWGRGGHLGW